MGRKDSEDVFSHLMAKINSITQKELSLPLLYDYLKPDDGLKIAL